MTTASSGLSISSRRLPAWCRCYTDLKNPDFGEVAKAMGLWGRSVAKAGELEESIQSLARTARSGAAACEGETDAAGDAAVALRFAGSRGRNGGLQPPGRCCRAKATTSGKWWWKISPDRGSDAGAPKITGAEPGGTGPSRQSLWRASNQIFLEVGIGRTLEICLRPSLQRRRRGRGCSGRRLSISLRTTRRTAP